LAFYIYTPTHDDETIDEEEKIEHLLLTLKRMIGSNGFITNHRVEVN